MNTKKEVVKELCKIMCAVGEAHDNKYSYDCVCDDTQWVNFCVEKSITDFIKLAVEEKLVRDGLTVPEDRD